MKTATAIACLCLTLLGPSCGVGAWNKRARQDPVALTVPEKWMLQSYVYNGEEKITKGGGAWIAFGPDNSFGEFDGVNSTGHFAGEPAYKATADGASTQSPITRSRRSGESVPSPPCSSMFIRVPSVPQTEFCTDETSMVQDAHGFRFAFPNPGGLPHKSNSESLPGNTERGDRGRPTGQPEGRARRHPAKPGDQLLGIW